MQVGLVDSSGLMPSATSGGGAPSVVSLEQKAQFEQMVGGGGAISGQISSAVNYVENKFNAKHVEIVKSLKDFEESGSAVSLMMASHQGANNSVMVQLCGTVSKKCADNAEQLYKQQ